MNRRYKKYERESFDEWRGKVKKYLPELVIKFYTSTKYIPYEHHVILGRVIKDINNPFYAITDEYRKPLDSMEVTAAQVVLEINVNNIFKFIKSL